MHNGNDDQETRAQPADIVDATPDDTPVSVWWQRSAQLAAGAALAIGLATMWFGGMLGRVPLDSHSTLGYLLMLPLLLIVPAFSFAALRLAWAAWSNQSTSARPLVAAMALAAAVLNGLAISRFAMALWRIFLA